MISIVIPTYKNLDGLKLCLESIRINTDNLSDIDIWIVANGCRNGTEDYVRSLGSPFNLIATAEPLGYTKAVNVGMAASKGDLICLLNDDVQLLDWGGHGAWLRMLSDPFQDPLMAVTGSTRDFWSKDKPFLVFFCVMLRRSVVFELGMLDEFFNPGCGEDADFCLKVQQRGYRIRQVPVEHDHWHTNFPIWHIGNVTFSTIEGKNSVVDRNHAELERRYPRTKEDADFQVAFSKGLQNSERWNK